MLASNERRKYTFKELFKRVKFEKLKFLYFILLNKYSKIYYKNYISYYD